MNTEIYYLVFHPKKNCFVQKRSQKDIKNKLYSSFEWSIGGVILSVFFLIIGLAVSIGAIRVLFEGPGGSTIPLVLLILSIGCATLGVSFWYIWHTIKKKGAIPEYIYISEDFLLVGELTNYTSDIANNLKNSKDLNEKIDKLKSYSIKLIEIAIENITNVIILTKKEKTEAGFYVWNMQDIEIISNGKEIMLNINELAFHKAPEALALISYFYSKRVGEFLPCETQEI